ncbi:Acetyltransferase [Alkalibacterium sp. AK22]|uniref:GNAT family N-acetyltransferase n=1 Tax=Alkalibacterium sp. AK22 TaxID=1229520 RepID=UPI00044F37F9|nr:GNAT family N-acetyltransferase [Alkalibacterium sp. AK22]EXJ23180.1 Acetyltransferase [Alkalibacterium sp. AK22]
MTTFHHLCNYSSLLEENDFFRLYVNSQSPLRYDSNYCELLYTPTQKEFKLIEDIVWNFALEQKLTHIKIVWPENQGILSDTLTHLDEERYKLEKLELYTIDPSLFIAKADPAITVRSVDKSSFRSFIELNRIEDSLVSERFANMKQLFYQQIIQKPHITLLMAEKEGTPAGSCIMIDGDSTVEIDDLFTAPTHRKSGVARTLQSWVMAHAVHSGKEVILAADAEDTHPLMYQKQGYRPVSFRIGALKTFEEDDH